MLITAMRRFFAHNWRRRWLIPIALLLVGLLGDWRWAIISAVLVLAIALLSLWSVRRRVREAERKMAAYIGEISASSSELTYVCSGQSTSITWNEIKSVAYAQDPMTQQNEWWLRSSVETRQTMSIPDHPAIRAKLMMYLATHLPAFNSNVFDDLVRDVFSQDNNAVIECWSRRGDEGGGV